MTELLKHQSFVHIGGLYYDCLTCGESIFAKDHISRHMLIHIVLVWTKTMSACHVAKPYGTVAYETNTWQVFMSCILQICMLCGNASRSRRLENTWKVYMSFVIQLCMLCGKGSRSRRLRKKHMKSVHALCPSNLYVMWQRLTEPPPKKKTHEECSSPLKHPALCCPCYSPNSVIFARFPFPEKKALWKNPHTHTLLCVVRVVHRIVL